MHICPFFFKKKFSPPLKTKELASLSDISGERILQGEGSASLLHWSNFRGERASSEDPGKREAFLW